MSEGEKSAVVANDDDGHPITEQDLVLESHRRPLADNPANLIPPFEFEGDEDDWEDQQLIEAVKARRRAARVHPGER